MTLKEKRAGVLLTLACVVLAIVLLSLHLAKPKDLPAEPDSPVVDKTEVREKRAHAWEHIAPPPHIKNIEAPWVTYDFKNRKPPKEEHVYTVKSLLSAALDPVGDCLYIYGGGWNEEDTAAGVEALSLGVSPRWHEFYEENSAAYDHREHLYEIHNGLDCTGYLGYAMYQVFEGEYSRDGYVFASRNAARGFESLFGGTITPSASVDDRLAGDIMTKDGHVYLTIGTCSDGSVLFLHSSPPNVTLGGTPTPYGNTYSEAYRLAHKYMDIISPDAHARYENCLRGMEYLSEYDRYRFPDDVLADPDGYRDMTPAEIMEDLTASRGN